MDRLKNYFKVFTSLIDKEASKQAMEACESIISEMGAELHDDLIQKLSVLRLKLDKLELTHTDPVIAKPVIDQMQSDFEAVSDSVRRISRRLHPIKIDGDSFETTLANLCRNIEGPATLRIQVESTGLSRTLPHEKENYLLRMVQELIHNSMRHSSAWHIWIRLTWHPESLILEVEDDGSGFARIKEFIKKLEGKNNTIRMRALALGAKVDYRQGTRGLLATIDYPFPN